MPTHLPKPLVDAIESADTSWRPILLDGLTAVAEAHPDYLTSLVADDYLPTQGRIFSAFRQPLGAIRQVLIGEGPYPREKSATGVCFMDGAVESLWSESGLSKQVNRATSLRNFMKMLLVAQGMLSIDHTTADAMVKVSSIARASGSTFIQTLAELQRNLEAEGFLLLNAALVFRPTTPAVKEAKPWQPFMRVVLNTLADFAERKAQSPPTLVLWGKIAEQLDGMPEAHRFPMAIAEHPYNLTFIGNATMQALFGPMNLLHKK
ncbi:MAG: uracil-DNA glycosylase [Herminiimonas sp.]|nr:uracil-DNA glycosylase [Herminiimonas sp.]